MQFCLSEVERMNEVYLCESLVMPRVQDECGQVDSIGDVRAEVDVAEDAAVFHVEGKLAADVKYNCSRCLSAYPAKLVAPFDESFTKQADKAKNGVHLVEGEVVLLDPFIEQELFLAIEFRPLCSLECKGLCPECGCNRNEVSCSCNTEKLDLRFSILKDLHFEADSE